MFRVGRGARSGRGRQRRGRALAEDYTKNRYHQPSDEYSPDWRWDGIAQEMELYYRLGRALATGDDLAQLAPDGDEFRARARQGAARHRRWVADSTR